jgi:glycosyltransferase involved in cell wall biosynthesis
MAKTSDQTAAKHDAEVRVIRESPHFDREYYLSQVNDPAARRDPALHYLLVGEPAGINPSRSFALDIYARLNPDIRGSGMSLLAHYETHGRKEERQIAYESDRIVLDASRLDPGKPTVLLLLHEATYSGAPILGWNLLKELKLTRNVVVMVRKGGPLIPALKDFATAVVEPQLPRISESPIELERLAERIVETYQPIYAIANSVETRLMATAIRTCQVPVVTLVHEFVTHTPPHALTPLYKMCDAFVFPSDLVYQSSLQRYEILAQRHCHIQPQGPSEIPRLRADEAIESYGAGPRTTSKGLADLLAERNPPFTVVGLGPIDLRKGVDLFVATATALQQKYGGGFRFIWVGERVHADHHQYNVFLDEQVHRSGVTDKVHFFGPVDNLGPVYDAADALFISSRLDPLPNVGIDASLKGIPLLCFEKATGFAEIMAGQEETAWLVSPHLDTGAVADRIARLMNDAEARTAAGEMIRRIARLNFNMMRYTRSLDEMGRVAARRIAEVEMQIETLLPDNAFNADLYFGKKKAATLPREEAVRTYLLDTVNVDFTGDAAWGEHERRPLEGFHSLMYGRLCPDFPHDGSINPLTHYIRAGRPDGPWKHDVLHLSGNAPVRRPAKKQSVALHGHFHYVDNFAEFMEGLAANTTHVDLHLTTTTEAAAAHLEAAAAAYKNGDVSISVLPNIGRDIRPFIQLLKGPLASYDVVGHLHGKRSVHTFDYDKDLGNRWRIFLWQHLLGPAMPAMDVILRTFTERPDLGMVFPENDYLVGWELNRELSESLAPRLGLRELPEHLEFPVGTMFWARPGALAGFVEASFADDEYPTEPLPIDGTMLHALERLLPVVVEASGYKLATTYFPRFTR